MLPFQHLLKFVAQSGALLPTGPSPRRTSFHQSRFKKRIAAAPVRQFGFAAKAGFLAASLLGILLMLAPAAAQAQEASGAVEHSLRFYGHGSGGIDRVLIPLDAPARPVDVGASDFTIEFWVKANAADNSGAAACSQNDGWITSNIIIDRDIYFAGDHGDYGIGLSNGRIAFGLSVGGSGTTLCGSRSVADGAWHHVAVTRQLTGEMRLFVDGVLDATTTGSSGNASYRDGRQTSFANDPFLVLGAEKHDAGSAYPSFSGFIDELRFSNTLRYTGNFVVPTSAFTPDASTSALYHFNEGPAGACTGTVTDSATAAGGPSHGACSYGGAGTAGPVYAADSPFAGAAPATPTAAPTLTNTPAPPTPTPTNTPQLPTATPQPTATPLPTATPQPTAAPPNTPTPAPTNTPPPPTATPTTVADLIFADGFETGNLLAWSLRSVDGGDLSVTAAAAMVGSRGMQAAIDDNTPIYVADERPAAEPRYRARFAFDPNTVTMANGDRYSLIYGIAAASTPVLHVELLFSSGSYQLIGSLLNDAGAWIASSPLAISDAPHAIELDWRAATSAGANDGYLTLWIDGTQRASLTGIDNDTRRIDTAALGAVNVDSGTRGTVYFDDFISRRSSYIGTVAGIPAPGVDGEETLTVMQLYLPLVEGSTP